MQPAGPARVDGGELVARTLREAGVSTVFALHGGHLESFYRACPGQGLELLDTRHEASAGHAAEGYARVTGELGVCVVTAGPGFANAVPAILNAYVDQVPVLFLIGAPPLRERETNELQGGFDQVAMAAPMATWAVSVPTTERIPDLLAAAVRRATTGRRGPVVVELPIDVLHMDVEEATVTRPTGLLVRPRPTPSPTELATMVDHLRRAERPVVVVGGEARFSNCGGALAELARTTGIPVLASKRGLGLLPAGHPQDGHDVGNLGLLSARGQQGPDVVLLAGARQGLFLGGSGDSILPRDATILQVSGDAAELGRTRDVAVGVTADVGATLEGLLAAAGDEPWPDLSAWSARVTGLQHEHAASYPDVEGLRGLHPFHVMAQVAAVAGPEAVYALDGGEAGQWAVQHARTSGPGRVLTTGYFGGLGVAPGFAIGAQQAAPDRRVVLVSGDGSIGFHVQELDTMVHRRLPVVTVVLNNEIWGMSLHGQQIMFGRDYQAIATLPGRHYADIARGFGCHAERVTSFDGLRPALERAFGCGGPALVEVMTDPDVVSPGLVRMLGDVDPEIPQVVIPYYQNIPR